MELVPSAETEGELDSLRRRLEPGPCEQLQALREVEAHGEDQNEVSNGVVSQPFDADPDAPLLVELELISRSDGKAFFVLVLVFGLDA